MSDRENILNKLNNLKYNIEGRLDLIKMHIRDIQSDLCKIDEITEDLKE